MKKIKIIKDNKKDYLNLLLMADPDEKMIDLYLEKGTMFVTFADDKPVCAAVVIPVKEDTLELKNIATDEAFWKQGLAREIVTHISGQYKGKYKELIVGTADMGIAFYQKLGFEVSHKIKNFFTDNYPETIFDNGIQCIDMIYLKKTL